MDFKNRVAETVCAQYGQELIDKTLESTGLEHTFEKVRRLCGPLANEVEDAFTDSLTDIVHKLTTSHVEVKITLQENQPHAKNE